MRGVYLDTMLASGRSLFKQFCDNVVQVVSSYASYLVTGGVCNSVWYVCFQQDVVDEEIGVTTEQLDDVDNQIQPHDNHNADHD